MKQVASSVRDVGQAVISSPPQKSRAAVQPNDPSLMHAVPLQMPPTPQAEPEGATIHRLPEQVWHTPQSLSLQQDPARRHFLPHFTFGDLHFFLRRFASPSLWLVTATAMTRALPSTLRRDCMAARVIPSKWLPSIADALSKHMRGMRLTLAMPRSPGAAPWNGRNS
jgi:hypothetical protein